MPARKIRKRQRHDASHVKVAARAWPYSYSPSPSALNPSLFGKNTGISHVILKRSSMVITDTVARQSPYKNTGPLFHGAKRSSTWHCSAMSSCLGEYFRYPQEYPRKLSARLLQKNKQLPATLRRKMTSRNGGPNARVV